MELSHLKHWLHDLRRRHVGRVLRGLAAYGVVAMALVELTEPVMHALHLPEWTLTLVVVLLGLGFPVVAVVAWAAGDAAGDAGAPHPEGAESASSALGVRRALILVGIGFLVAAPGVLWFAFRRAPAIEATPGPASPSVAILPFADLSPAHDQGYLADGVAEEILNALAHVEGLRVAGRTSSFYFRGKDVKLAEIGRELNVGAILEGSVRKDGPRVRVTAQLVDVAGGAHLWSETFDREMAGIFALQDDIARSVVSALEVKLMRGGPGPAPVRTTDNPEAYAQYLLGRHFFDTGTDEGFARATAALEKALAIDPRYARAWAWLSISVLNAVTSSRVADAGTEAVDAVRSRAIEAAERAVALAPQLAESWSARGWIRSRVSWDWDGARSDLERALALDPRDPNILLRHSQLLAATGRLPDAIAGASKAIEIDPLYAWAHEFLASYQLGSGRPELALKAARRAVEIEPQHLLALEDEGDAHLLLGDPGRALEAFQRHPSAPLRLAGVARALHDLGRHEESDRALDELRARFASQVADRIGLTYAWRGDADRAFEWLERATGQYSFRLRRVTFDPMLRGLRRDPRYAALLARMNLR